METLATLAPATKLRAKRKKKERKDANSSPPQVTTGDKSLARKLWL